MLPPPTVPCRSTTLGEAESSQTTPSSSTTSSTVSVPIRQQLNDHVWSDRAFISSGSFAGKSMRLVHISVRWLMQNRGVTSASQQVADKIGSISRWHNNRFMEDVKPKRIDDLWHIVPLFGSG
jgi:hypothetical protein